MISLAGRLHNSLPDCYINAKHYIHEVQKVLQSKVGDPSFTRKMGLNISSMLLGIEHQRKFDCLMARHDDCAVMKEPFDREVRAKMTSLQKQTLEGLDKYQALGALSKKNNDLLTMYASNKIPAPKPRSDRPNDRKRRRPDGRNGGNNGSRGENNSRRPRRDPDRRKRTRDDQKQRSARKRSRNDDKTRTDDHVENTRSEKGEIRGKISKLSQPDLQNVIALAKLKGAW